MELGLGSTWKFYKPEILDSVRDDKLGRFHGEHTFSMETEEQEINNKIAKRTSLLVSSYSSSQPDKAKLRLSQTISSSLVLFKLHQSLSASMTCWIP